MKKNGRDELLERIGEKEEIIASKAKPSRKPLKPDAPEASARKRVLPPPLNITILDMRAVLR